MSIPQLPFTEQQLQAMGLPPRDEHELLCGALAVAHYVVGGAELVHGIHGANAAGSGAAANVPIALAAVGPGIAMAALACEVVDAHQEGEALGRRNVWKTAFAFMLQAQSRGQDWHASNHVLYGNQEMRGRNAAVRLLRNMTRQERQTFLRQFAGRDGYRVALSAVGGIEV